LRRVSWDAWVERWERQQERYLVDREGRFALMLDYAQAQLDTAEPRVLDLCCGNGALSRRLLERFPDARVTAVDWDPVHLEIARKTLPERVEIVEADVTRAGWDTTIAPGSLDLVVTATALHWIDDAPLTALYEGLGELVAPGGLFLNADHLPQAEPTIRRLSETQTEAWREANFRNGEETHSGFHEAAAADTELSEAAELRARRFAEHVSGDHRPRNVEFHRAALREVGFGEVAEVWRFRDDAVLLALRA
jgi:trans-aconitate methyltransferase